MNDKLITPEILQKAIGSAATVAIFWIIFGRGKH